MSKAQWGKFPGSFIVKILERTMSKEELIEIKKRYDLAKERAGYHWYEPSKQDIKLYIDWLEEKKLESEIAKAMGVSKGTVKNRFAAISKLVYNGDVTLPKKSKK